MNPRRYARSKFVYAVLLELSILSDIVLALSGYEWLRTILPDIASLALAALGVASLLAIVLYFIHMWQIEVLTGAKTSEMPDKKTL